MHSVRWLGLTAVLLAAGVATLSAQSDSRP